MRVAFAADHAGAALKAELIRRIAGVLPEDLLIDLGGDGSDPLDDYPDFALALGRSIQDGIAERGILICGSGQGMVIAANKISGAYAALCWLPEQGRAVREHNGANIICLPGDTIQVETAAAIIDNWLAAEPKAGDYARRRMLIERLEQGEAI